MPTGPFNQSLVEYETPWAACAAIDEFLMQGGECRMDDESNWILIVFICETKVRESSQLHHALAWANVAILIRESLAREYSPEEGEGVISVAMRVRVNMIIRCGNHPGDFICDCNKVVEWCTSRSSVRETLKMTTIPPILYVDPRARSVAEILTYLVEEGRLKPEGDVARLLDFIAQAERTLRVDDSLKWVPPASGES